MKAFFADRRSARRELKVAYKDSGLDVRSAVSLPLKVPGKRLDRDDTMPYDGNGLLEVAAPSSTNTPVDVVLVHGLAGGRYSTWATPDKQFWPLDILPKDLPFARIFSFGYRSDIGTLGGKTTFEDSANLLLVELARSRETRSRCPIIFVAHSLGGLVVENMLVEARSSHHQNRRDVYTSTAAIAFLATPHRGSNLAGWTSFYRNYLRMMKFQSNADLVADFVTPAESLASVQTRFFEAIRADRKGGTGIRICFFIETLKSPGGSLIVPGQAARIPGYQSKSLAAYHSDMAKFKSSDDPNYSIFKHVLLTWFYEIGNSPKSSEHEEDGRLGSEAAMESAVFDRIVGSSADVTNSRFRQSRTSVPYASTTGLTLTTDPQRMEDQEENQGELVAQMLNDGRLEDAEDIQRQLVEASTLARGPEDALTLVLKRELGSIYQIRGLWQEAERLLRDVLSKSLQQFGNQDQRTIRAMSSLAQTLYEQGKFAEAEILQKYVTEEEIDQLGSEHLDTLDELELLALIYWAEARFDESVELRDRVYVNRLKILGENHPATLKSRADIIMMDIDRGLKPTEAMEQEQRRIALYLRNSEGKGRLDTMQQTENLVRILVRTGHLEEAQDLQEEVTFRMREMLGPEHPNALTSMQNLAIVYHALGVQKNDRRLLVKAERQQWRVINSMNDVLGSDHGIVQKAREISADIQASVKAMEKGDSEKG